MVTYTVRLRCVSAQSQPRKCNTGSLVQRPARKLLLCSVRRDETKEDFFFQKRPLLIADHMAPSCLTWISAQLFSTMSRLPRLVRSALSTQPALGGASGTYSLPCRKVVVEYCEKSVASKGTRDFLLQNAAALARSYPSVEFVVMPRPQRAPILRGFYCEYTIS